MTNLQIRKFLLLIAALMLVKIVIDIILLVRLID